MKIATEANRHKLNESKALVRGMAIKKGMDLTKNIVAFSVFAINRYSKTKIARGIIKSLLINPTAAKKTTASWIMYIVFKILFFIRLNKLAINTFLKLICDTFETLFSVDCMDPVKTGNP